MALARAREAFTKRWQIFVFAKKAENSDRYGVDYDRKIDTPLPRLCPVEGVYVTSITTVVRVA